MDAKTVIKAWKWFAVTLVVLNAALCFGIFVKPQKNNPPLHERLDDFITGKLHFSAEQIEQFDELKQRHHDSIVILQHYGGKMRTALFDNLKNASKTETQLDSLMAAIGENQKEIEFVTYRHFRQLREVCNDEQKKVFDEIIQDVLKKMFGRPPRPAGPPPPGGPPEPRP